MNTSVCQSWLGRARSNRRTWSSCLGTSGVATQYVNPVAAAALPATAQIVSVRIWVLLRSDTRDPGFTDSRTYVYANRTLACTVNSLTAANSAACAFQPNDSFRRLLVSRTVMVRNSLGT